MSELERIIGELEREHTGDPWHGSPLRQILDGVDATTAAARPIHGAHSIWELVLHITAWKREVRRRLLGAPADEPQEGDWPEVGTTSEALWRDALARLERAQRDLIAAIRTLQGHQLDEPTSDPRAPDGVGATFYVQLHGIVQHDVYHTGQIAILKKAQ